MSRFEVLNNRDINKPLYRDLYVCTSSIAPHHSAWEAEMMKCRAYGSTLARRSQHLLCQYSFGTIFHDVIDALGTPFHVHSEDAHTWTHFYTVCLLVVVQQALATCIL